MIKSTENNWKKTILEYNRIPDITSTHYTISNKEIKARENTYPKIDIGISIRSNIVYLLVGVAFVSGIAFLITTGSLGALIDHPNTVGNETTGDEPRDQTNTGTETPEPTTETQTPTPIPTDYKTETKADETTKVTTTEEITDTPYDAVAYRERQYKSYMKKFNTSLYNNNVNVSRYSTDAENKSATIYWTENPNNSTSHVLNRQKSTILYAESAEVIRNSENSSAEAVPKRIYFSIHTLNGELYMITHIDYMTAFRYSTGSINIIDYQTEYEKNAEYGPAHPRYEENQTATAASA